MKKFVFLFALAAMALSCQVRQLEPEDGGSDAGQSEESGACGLEFRAFAEQPDSALSGRASLDECKVVWTKGDRISIIDAAGHKAVYEAASSGSIVTFKYSSGASLDAESDYTAYYPESLSDGYMPSNIGFVDGNISYIPMKALSKKSTELKFRHLCGLVRLTLQGQFTDICAVALSTDRPVSGRFDRDVVPGTPAVVDTVGHGSLQITVPEGTDGGVNPRDISGGRSYYFPVPEGTYSAFWIGILGADSKKIAYWYASQPITVRRAVILPISPISVTKLGNGENETVNLSGSETSNCYLANMKRDYRFYAKAKGNRGKSATDFTPVSADVLWENSLTGTSYRAVKPVIYFDGYIYFRKNRQNGESYHPGNSVIAARDASGNILWSWHIWAPGQNLPSTTAYANSAGNVMDRNLGALGVTPGTPESIGMFYQWGRKDPFPANFSDVFPAPAKTTSSIGTVDYTVSHPTQFLYGCSESCYDWHYKPQTAANWSGTSKGVHDPCPVGWRMPSGDSHGALGASRGSTPITHSGLMTKAFGTGYAFSASYWDDENKGVSLPSSVCGSETWIPAAGYIDPEDGSLQREGVEGSLWTGTGEPVMSSIASDAYCFSFAANRRVNPTAFSARAAGRNVRCIKVK